MGEQYLSMLVNKLKTVSGIKFFLLVAARSPKTVFRYLYRMRHSFKKK